MPRDAEQFMSVAEVAKFLRIGERSVRRLVAEKALGANDFRGAVRISRDELERYIKQTRR